MPLTVSRGNVHSQLATYRSLPQRLPKENEITVLLINLSSLSELSLAGSELPRQREAEGKAGQLWVSNHHCLPMNAFSELGNTIENQY